MLPTINAIWIGKKMGRIQAACLRSFLKTDHTVLLHSYGEVVDAPRGVQFRDANLLLPEDRLLRYAVGGSYAISSNLMRYEILRRGLGLYVDCDVYCFRPLDDADVIFGRQDNTSINTAVLKLPPESAVLADLCAIQPGWAPPWLERKHASATPRSLEAYRWGTTGPLALTYHAKSHGIDGQALPCDVLYPVPHDRWSMFDDPGLRLNDLVTARTRYIHLWNEMRRRGEAANPPPKSPLGEMILRTTGSPLRRAARKVYRRIWPAKPAGQKR